jgi:hypothetical protein
MAQHFLLSKAAKTLSLAQVFRMTDAEAESTFKMNVDHLTGEALGLLFILLDLAA